MFPVADYVFDAVLFMGGSGEEVALMVQQELTLFFALVERALSAVEPFYIFQLGVFVELVEETVAEASGGEKKNRK